MHKQKIPSETTDATPEALIGSHMDGLEESVALEMLERVFALDPGSPEVKLLTNSDLVVEIGSTKIQVNDSSVIGAGGTKRVFAIPESDYVLALPNTPGSYRNIIRWQGVVEEPTATQELSLLTGLPFNPDMYLAGAKIGNTDFPVLIMRAWSSLDGLVLDGKNPTHDKDFAVNLDDPDTAAERLKPILDGAINDVEHLLSLGIALGADQINLITNGDNTIETRLFATEITRETLDTKLRASNLERAKRFMVARVIDTYLKHTLTDRAYFDASTEWDGVVEQLAQSYGTTYYGR